jgi:Na+-translocating ferredoxin:NAD+ oxidoreductase subunit C
MSLIVRHFKGGVHPREGKELSCSKPIQTAPLLDNYYVILHQHIGAPPKLLVKTGDEVKKGQMLAESGGFVSAPVHAPTSGKVKIVEWPGSSGTKMQTVEIDADGTDEWDASIQHDPNWKKISGEEIKKRVANAGVVGMGGAAFPTFVKLSPPADKKIDTLILNGAECEPYLTADHRLMLEEAEKIVTGAQLLAKALNVNKVYIGIENNKPDAVEKLNKVADKSNVEVVSLRVRYPQGAEKQLIYAVTGREVPPGRLPMDVGCVVQNVGTAAAVTDAVVNRIPLIERVTTVTGSTVCNPGNWKFRVGTPLSKVLELAGGINKQPAKILFGGPMMGMAQSSLDVPIMKNASGVLLLAKDEIAQYSSHPCIRCGRCTDVCPMSLMAGTLSLMIESENFDLAEYTNVMDCIECGSCAYVCPALRPLVQHMRRGKAEVVAGKKQK